MTALSRSHSRHWVSWGARYLYAGVVTVAAGAGAFNAITIFAARGDYGVMAGTLAFLTLPFWLAFRILRGSERALWLIPLFLSALAATMIVLPLTGMTNALKMAAFLCGLAAIAGALALASRHGSR